MHQTATVCVTKQLWFLLTARLMMHVTGLAVLAAAMASLGLNSMAYTGSLTLARMEANMVACAVCAKLGRIRGSQCA